MNALDRSSYPKGFNLWDVTTWPKDFGTDQDIAEAEEAFGVPPELRGRLNAGSSSQSFKPENWNPELWQRQKAVPASDFNPYTEFAGDAMAGPEQPVKKARGRNQKLTDMLGEV